MKNLSDIRREYLYAGLAREDCNPDPFQQFSAWLEQAVEWDLDTPNALSLATVASDGLPSLRTVLLKASDQRGLVFFTHYGSRKAKELAENPQAAMLFHWLQVDRQVKVQGRVEKISMAESLAYFQSRPRDSQLGAWCSDQSTPIASRELLMQAFNSMKQKFAEGDIPLPDFWGGYRLIPSRFEFWQGRASRLHDRFEYTPADAGAWKIQRLAP